MSNRLAPSLQNILYTLVNFGTREANSRELGNAPGRFPVVVRPETRIFLEAQAKALGSSMAGVAGSILDGVAMTTMHGDDAAYSLSAIADRFSLLIHEHGLSFPAAAEVLHPLGITLHELADADRLRESLTAKRLQEIADLFHINYDWLAGKSGYPGKHIAHSWYKNVEGAAHALLAALKESDDVELCIVCPRGTDFSQLNDDHAQDKLPHFIPVLIRNRELPGGESLETFEIWDEGRWSYWRCRYHIKMVFQFAVWLEEGRLDMTNPYFGRFKLNGHFMEKENYQRLREQTVLPTSILSGTRHVDWHPGDYVEPKSPVSKELDEWLHIKQSEATSMRFLEDIYASVPVLCAVSA